MAKGKTNAGEDVGEKLNELREFVLENKEIIMNILDETLEGKPSFDKVMDNPVGRTVRKSAESVEETLWETFRAITSKEVQTHFVRMGVEFFMGMEALIKALPLPPVLETAYEEVDDATVRLRETICENNPDCLYKPKRKVNVDAPVAEDPAPKTVRKRAPARKKVKETSDGLEKIELG